MSRLTAPLLAAFDIKKHYETSAGQLSILKGVNFSLHPGEMALILGRSGSGKSTLLHILGGLDEPSSGRIVFEGQDIVEMDEKQVAKIRNRKIGFVFQFYHLLPELTLFENVVLPSMIAGRRDDKWAKEVLRIVKLASRRDHYPSELSGGEQQRAAFARALINRPSVVLCDEPTGNLDEATAEEVIALVNELNQREGQSFVIVTHDESLSWRYGNSFRIQDGILMRDNGGPVKMEQLS